MAQVFDTQAFQNAGFTFEEIMKIRSSLEEYESSGISYTEKEVWDHIESLRALRYAQNV